MDAIEKYEELKELITTGAKFMGINVMDFNFKPNFRTLVTSGIILMLNFCIIFTCFRSAPKIMLMFRALAMSGVAVASTYKFFFTCWYREDYHNIVRKVNKLYEENAKLGEYRAKKLVIA
jgi:hypothetical protein